VLQEDEKKKLAEFQSALEEANERALAEVRAKISRPVVNRG
jgi:hypothetical protein